MKPKKVNYNSANFWLVDKDDEGLHLRSGNKNLGDVIVAHKFAKYVHDGWKK